MSSKIKKSYKKEFVTNRGEPYLSSRVKINGDPLLKPIEVEFISSETEGGFEEILIEIHSKLKKGFYGQGVWGTLRFCMGQPGYWFSNIDFNFDTDLKFRKLNKNEKNNTKLSNNEFLFKKYIIPIIKSELKIFKLKFEIVKNKRKLSNWIKNILMANNKENV